MPDQELKLTVQRQLLALLDDMEDAQGSYSRMNSTYAKSLGTTNEAYFADKREATIRRKIAANAAYDAAESVAMAVWPDVLDNILAARVPKR